MCVRASADGHSASVYLSTAVSGDAVSVEVQDPGGAPCLPLRAPLGPGPEHTDTGWVYLHLCKKAPSCFPKQWCHSVPPPPPPACGRPGGSRSPSKWHTAVRLPTKVLWKIPKAPKEPVHYSQLPTHGGSLPQGRGQRNR